MDSALIPEGVKRCPTWQFILWIGAVGVVVLWGVLAMILVYFKGLNQTNMNNAYGFASMDLGRPWDNRSGRRCFFHRFFKISCRQR